MIEGQGSVGVEIEAQLGAAPPMVIVPCGGGGLSGGIALALPDSQIVAVEPEGWDDMARSLAGGAIVPVAEPAPPTRCDALQTKLVSPLTFGALRDAGARGLAVSEAEVAAAMVFAFRNLRIVAEPGGAVALAALIAGKVDAPEGQRGRRLGRECRSAGLCGDIARRLSVRRDQADEAGELIHLPRGLAAARPHRPPRPRPGRASAALSMTPSSSRERLGRIALSIESSACPNWRWSWKLMPPFLAAVRLSLCERRGAMASPPDDRSRRRSPCRS